MDGTPGRSAEPDGDERAVAQEAAQDATERYGPLELRRLRKEDGRMLIVYSRAERER